MPKQTPPTDAKAGADTATPEPRNVAVEALQNAIKIGGVIVAQGRVTFPLTKTQAQELEALNLVRIIGTWS